jgi:hypothetical protein
LEQRRAKASELGKLHFAEHHLVMRLHQRYGATHAAAFHGLRDFIGIEHVEPHHRAPSRRAMHGCDRSATTNNNSHTVVIRMARKPKPNGGSTMNSEQDLALAKALMDRGEMDAAEELIEKLEHVAKAQQAADDAEDDQDDLDDDAGDDGDDEEEEDDGDDDVAKAIRYPQSDDDFLSTQHQNMGPVSAQTLSPYPHGTGVTDVVQRPGRHPFDDAVSRVQARDGCSRNAAMITARVENPALYTLSSPPCVRHQQRAVDVAQLVARSAHQTWPTEICAGISQQ